MKVALLHDWLVGYRGGERILDALCEMFPEAEIYTLLHDTGSTSERIESKKIHTSFLNSISGIHTQYRKFLPLFPKAAESLKIPDDVDLVVSSSHCVIKGVRKPARAKHISYIHSPMRYLYDQFDTYFGSHAPLYQQWGAKAFRGYLTRWDLASNKNVDLMIANSHFVQERITRLYNRDSKVVFPFVELDDFQSPGPAKKDYYLMVTAFAPNKRVDLAVQAFKNLNRPLKIIGSGQVEAELKAMKSDQTEFLGNLDRREVIRHMQEARGFVFPGVEDFGITPLESLAAGTPVIAFRAGGVLDTLNEQVAQFFEQATSESLGQAILDFEKRSFADKALRERAKEFSKSRFLKDIQTLVGDLL